MWQDTYVTQRVWFPLLRSHLMTHFEIQTVSHQVFFIDYPLSLWQGWSGKRGEEGSWPCHTFERLSTGTRILSWLFYRCLNSPRASLVAQMVKNLPAMQEIQVWSLGWEKIPWRREGLPTPVFLPGEFHAQKEGSSPRRQREGNSLGCELNTSSFQERFLMMQS